MATITKTFTFDASVDGWSATLRSSVSLTRNTTDGSPGIGSLSTSTTTKNLAAGVSFWEITGTWESIFGIPTGSTITSIGATGDGFRHKASVLTAPRSGANFAGPLEIRDSAAALLGTLVPAQTAYTATTAWLTTASATPYSVLSAQQPSNTTIKLRLSTSTGTANTTGASITLLQDQVVVTVTYTPPAPTTDLAADLAGTHTLAADGTAVSPTVVSFLSAGGEETQGFSGLWDLSSGSVSYDNTMAAGGSGSFKFDLTATPTAAYLRKGGVVLKAGSRIGFWLNFSDYPTASTAIFRVEESVNSTVVMAINLRPTGILAHAPAGTSGITTLLPNTWYHITVAYVINATTDYTFKVYVDDVLDSTQTATDVALTNVNADSIKIGPIGTSWPASAALHYDGIYVDQGTDIGNPGKVKVASKRPIGTSENSTNNAFDTVVGTARAMGSRYLNVNESPPSDANGWTETSSSPVYEKYAIEAAATGDNISGATILGWQSWIRAKSSSSDTLSQVDNDTDYPFTSSATAAYYLHARQAAAYPTGLFGLLSGSASSATLYDSGVSIAYLPGSGSSLSGAAALAGTHSLAAAGSGAQSDSASLAGTHSLAASGTFASAGAAALAGTHSLGAAGANAAAGASSLAGTHTLSAASSASSIGTAALAGTHMLSGAGSGAQAGNAALAGTHTLGADGALVHALAANLAGAHSLVAAGAGAQSDSADLHSSHTLSSAGSGAQAGIAALAGVHSLIAASLQAFGGAAALAGTHSLTADASTSNITGASLAGTHTLSATSLGSFGGSAGLAGSHSLTASGSGAQSDSADLHSAHSLLAVGSNASAGTAALHSSHSIVATGAAAQSDSADLTAHGSLGVTGTLTSSGSAALAGTHTIVAASGNLFSGSAALAGTHSLSAAATVTLGGSAGLLAHATISVAGSTTSSGSGALSGPHSLHASGSGASAGAAAVSAHGALVAGSALGVNGAAALTAHASITVTGQNTQSASAALAGHASLSGSGEGQQSGAADLLAQGYLVADASLFVPVIPLAGKYRTYDVEARNRAYSVEARSRDYSVEARTRVFDVRSDTLVKKMDPKQPSEVYDFDFTWTRVFGTTGDTIATATVTVSPVETGGLTLQGTPTVQINPPLVKQWVAGGVSGNTYKLTCRITTTQGRQFEADMQIPVKDS